MNRIYRARLHPSTGIQAGLPEVLLVSITAEQARRQITILPGTPARRCFPHE